MSAVITASGISKQYRLGSFVKATLREAVVHGARRVVGKRPEQDSRDFWSLKDVSFTIGEGDVVGLIGSNGAGKSTLLKILSRITAPTTGEVRLHGRLGSLLEVGTGFHPELSGRDNIYLNGILLGMGRRDVARRFDEIVEFAEIATFIDTPVKRYSSGMYLRLAFAVAAHLEADILLIDEVLAVGDVEFQKKCLARIDEISHGGRTVIFVSHNMSAIQGLCSRVIWLDRGRVASDGPTREVLARYLQIGAASDSGLHRTWGRGEGPAGGSIQVREAQIVPSGGRPGDPIDVKTPFALELVLEHDGSSAPVTPSLVLFNSQDVMVLNVGPPGEPARWDRGMHRLRCQIPADLLNNDTYRVRLEIKERGELALSTPDLLTVQVLDSDADRHGWFGEWPGIIRPRLDWTRERVADEVPSRIAG